MREKQLVGGAARLRPVAPHAGPLLRRHVPPK